MRVLSCSVGWGIAVFPYFPYFPQCSEAERSAWEDWITRDRAEIARLSAEITKAEAQIDRIVYGLFDLTAEEIALLEASI